MKRMSNLWQLTAADLAAAIASKKVSCTEVVEAHLRRIEAVNPRVNAVVRVLGDEARRDAAEADRKVASGAAPGPLHGVPFTIKENIDVAASSRAFDRNGETKMARTNRRSSITRSTYAIRSRPQWDEVFGTHRMARSAASATWPKNCRAWDPLAECI